MTLLEELKALDIAEGKPDNIFARVLEYVQEMEENSELKAKIIELEFEVEDLEKELAACEHEKDKLTDEVDRLEELLDAAVIDYDNLFNEHTNAVASLKAEIEYLERQL